LARRAALEQMPAYRRQVLHARALAALAEPPIRPDTLSALAFHADQAGDQDAATRYGPAAAEQATVLGAHREAAELYALALRHAAKTPAEQKVAWLEQHAFASYLCGLAEVAARSWREAIALRHELGDRLGEGDDLRWLSHLLWPLGRSTEAREAGRASLELLEEFGLCPQLAWSMVNLAQLAAFEYDPAAAQYAARAIALGTQCQESVTTARNFSGRGWPCMDVSSEVAAIHGLPRTPTIAPNRLPKLNTRVRFPSSASRIDNESPRQCETYAKELGLRGI
jgi:tetratricopeptide (TPR) repeat protein